MVAPRIYGIPALDAPVVAVVRRGPSSWAGIGRWDLAAMTYEQGAWLRGTLYPQRCDLSPDGRWLCYFALKSSARWELGPTYVAISQLPQLEALAAWGTAGTWTRGAHFSADPAEWNVSPPEHGTVDFLRGRIGLALTAPASYAVERRRGWHEAEGTALRDAADPWEVRRAATLRMAKERPGALGVRLEVTGAYAAFRSGADSEAVGYVVVEGGVAVELRDAQWADWSPDGRLLVATRAGELQVREESDWSAPGVVVADLAKLRAPH
jgi:hypothetical protein